jgi:creatinine amidohydrolase
MDASELYDPEFRKLIKEKKPTIIIPVGSIEQHGAHLPITTDSDIVTEIASRLAKKYGFIVFPTISYGVSFEHEPLFSISISKAILKAHLKKIVESLMNNGIRSVIILNGHHGNRKTIDNFVDEWWADDRMQQTAKKEWKDAGLDPETIGNKPKVKCECYHYWDSKFLNHEFDHAGFVETSLMLAISDKVKMKKAKKGLITKGMSEKERKRINKLSTQPGGFPKVAPNGVWGDPTSATKKDGEKFLAEIIRNLAKECQS